MSYVNYKQPSAAVIKSNRSRQQVITGHGGNSLLTLKTVVNTHQDNFSVFKKGILLTPDIDYTPCGLNSDLAQSDTKYISAIKLNSSLEDSDVVQIVINTFSGDNLDLREVQNYFVNHKSFGGLPVGFILSYSGTNVPEGCLKCDGQIVKDCDLSYPQFFEFVSNNTDTVSFETYEEEIKNSTYTYKFGLNGTSVKLPSLDNSNYPYYIKVYDTAQYPSVKNIDYVVSNITSELENQNTEFKNNILQDFDEYKTNTNDTINTLSDNVSKMYADTVYINDSITNKVNNFLNNVDTDNSEFKDNINSDIEAFKKSVTDEINTFETDTNDKITTFEITQMIE